VPDYETVSLTRDVDGVVVITLDRPQALNALNDQMMADVVAAAQAADEDPGVGCLVLTGSTRAFAAGADIKEMADLDYQQVVAKRLLQGWDALARISKPILAAVSGHALGGGCELAMLCDLIVASETARFGQPEITLGVIPGIGGSQRLTRAIGKAKAMDLCLTGRVLTAREAEAAGLVARVESVEDYLRVTMEMAQKIAGFSQPAVAAAKHAVNAAFETTLQTGLMHERQVFYGCFATEDQSEGMAAFVGKRPPSFQHR
jgi:enoyl-CoA hydratase